MGLSAFNFETIYCGEKISILSEKIYFSENGIAERAFITSEGECRYRYDGGTPTMLEGHLLRDGAHLVLDGELQIRNFKAIGDARLSVSYERK